MNNDAAPPVAGCVNRHGNVLHQGTTEVVPCSEKFGLAPLTRLAPAALHPLPQVGEGMVVGAFPGYPSHTGASLLRAFGLVEKRAKYPYARCVQGEPCCTGGAALM